MKSLSQVEAECRIAYEKHIKTGINEDIKIFEDTKRNLQEASFSKDEEIILCTEFLPGFARFGYFIVTTEKCVLINPARMLNYEAESVYFNNITTASTEKKLGHSKVELHLENGKKLEFRHSKCKKIVDIILEQMSIYKSPVKKEQVLSTDDEQKHILERLEKLFSLYERNAITKEEYDLLKTKLINE
ncbi:PH domain-containing protein [Priestia aryabhattai]